MFEKENLNSVAILNLFHIISICPLSFSLFSSSILNSSFRSFKNRMILLNGGGGKFHMV
ncbi:MAG: hypothetical protein FWH29_08220 [Methanobrevibacter sp.]|nr:hypothetical protein [Methanobrevibacter sp.]